MTHEPECEAVTGDEHMPKIRTNACILCGIARTAYQRGRDDAADVVNVAIGDNGPLFNQDKQGDVMAWWDKTVAAARGDGEQA